MSAYERILDALANAGMEVKAKTMKARAQCPVHHSQGLTLSIRDAEDRAKVHCFAGCDTPDVLAEIGLSLRDLYDEPRNGNSGYVPPRRVRTPWEEAMAELGIHNPPPIEHLLHRMEVEQAKEAGRVTKW